MHSMSGNPAQFFQWFLSYLLSAYYAAAPRKVNSEQKRQGPTLMGLKSSYLQLCVLEARRWEKEKQGIAGEAQERRDQVRLWGNLAFVERNGAIFYPLVVTETRMNLRGTLIKGKGLRAFAPGLT